MTIDTDVLIVGGGAAGLRTAIELPRRRRGTRVVLVDSDAGHVYRPWLIYTAGGQLGESRLRVQHAELAERFGFSFQQGTVTDLDPHEGRATGVDIDVRYRALVLAPGAPADRSRIAGADEHAVFPCDLADARTFAKQLREAPGGRLAMVVSGERIGPGIEYASWLARNAAHGGGTKVTLVADGDVMNQQFGVKAARKIIEWFGGWDVPVHTSKTVESIDKQTVRFADGGAVEGDIVAVVGPLRGPDLPLASPAVDENGFIVVDEHLRSPHLSNTFVAGDALVRPGEAWRRSWQLSVRQADTVADNVAAALNGGALTPFDTKVARRLSRAALPDVGGRSVLVLNGRMLAAGRFVRKLRLRMDRSHFNGLGAEDGRMAHLPH